MDLDEPKKVWLMEPLKFNVSGLSDLVFPENDNDNLNITDDADAIHIVPVSYTHLTLPTSDLV